MPTTGNKVFQLVGHYCLSLANGVHKGIKALRLAIIAVEGKEVQSLTIQSHAAVYTTPYIHMNSFIVDPGDPIIGGGGHKFAYRLFGDEQRTVNS